MQLIERITVAQARRMALAAQGFGRRPPTGPVTMRQVQRVIDTVSQFQIDSVNVAVRAQYMPLFARCGPYQRTLLDRAAQQAPRRLFEYWGHAACLIDVELYPAFVSHMQARAATSRYLVEPVLAQKPDFVDRVLADVTERGPLTARQIDNVEQRRLDHWGWNWSEAKRVLEYLFSSGQISVAGRNAQFERQYDLTSRVIPDSVRERGDLSGEESARVLVRRSISALGVADLASIANYFYLKRASANQALADLTASGEVREVTVEGLAQRFWVATDAARPRTVTGQALLAPFDTLVHDRNRVEQLFGLSYRIEIYTPAHKRVYGYYVYLFLLEDALVARVDLKADRAANALKVQSAWLEETAEPRRNEVAAALGRELGDMASWLGLDGVRVTSRGTLAETLARHV